MDAAQALRELMELSSQITAAIVVDAEGNVLATAPDDPAASAALAASMPRARRGRCDLGPDGSDVTRVEVELEEGAVFVVREGDVDRRSDHRAEADLRARRLRPADVRAVDPAGGAAEEAAVDQEGEGGPRVRKLIRLAVLVGIAVWAWRTFFGPSGPEERAGVSYADGSDGRARAGVAGLRPACDDRPLGASSVTRDELGALLVERALLEGDFVLRSGRRSSWYLDKYRFETEPEILRALGEALAGAVEECEPDAVRLAGPALGAVALAASAAMASELPFIIVRGETKEYGTAKRIEGPFEPGELVCLLEDVVTSGGALAEAVSAVRDEGLVVRNAVCVVDREEGGSDALARLGVRLRPLFRASELLEMRKIPGKRHG